MAGIVLITGATSGFGKACAEKFASEGKNLIITARRAEKLQKLTEDLSNDYGVEILPLVFDVRDREKVTALLTNLPEKWTKIDVLINNAGLAVGRDLFQDADLDDWETMIDTNVKGLLYVSKAIVPLMIKNGKGHIINIGSTAGKEVYEAGNGYCASKHAVDAINKAMRIDLLKHGIRVTGIHPGHAETEFALVRFKGDAEKAAKVYEGIEPLTGKDIAEIAYFCTSLPEHVCINDLVVTCTQQANNFYLYRK